MYHSQWQLKLSLEAIVRPSFVPLNNTPVVTTDYSIMLLKKSDRAVRNKHISCYAVMKLPFADVSISYACSTRAMDKHVVT